MVYKEVCDVMNDVGIIINVNERSSVSKIDDVIEWIDSYNSQNNGVPVIDDGIKIVFDDKKRRFKSQREAVSDKEYGKPCGNPGSFKGPLHNVLINGCDYKQAVLDETESGGDNCSRLQISGSIIGAINGYDKIPKKWIDQTNVAKDALKRWDDMYKSSKL